MPHWRKWNWNQMQDGDTCKQPINIFYVLLEWKVPNSPYSQVYFIFICPQKYLGMKKTCTESVQRFWWGAVTWQPGHLPETCVTIWQYVQSLGFHYHYNQTDLQSVRLCTSTAISQCVSKIQDTWQPILSVMGANKR